MANTSEAKSTPPPEYSPIAGPKSESAPSKDTSTQGSCSGRAERATGRACECCERDVLHGMDVLKFLFIALVGNESPRYHVSQD
ncbi:hypothetical protein MRX96_009214 [Rhipicephalus microplus]